MAPLKVRVDGKGNPIAVVPAALRPPPEVLIENRLAWSYEDLALMTGLSVPTLRNLVSHHGFPHIRIGHRVLFTPESVRDWFAAQVVRLPPDGGELVEEKTAGEVDDCLSSGNAKSAASPARRPNFQTLSSGRTSRSLSFSTETPV